MQSVKRCGACVDRVTWIPYPVRPTVSVQGALLPPSPSTFAAAQIPPQTFPANTYDEESAMQALSLFAAAQMPPQTFPSHIAIEPSAPPGLAVSWTNDQFQLIKEGLIVIEEIS